MVSIHDSECQRDENIKKENWEFQNVRLVRQLRYV